MKRWLLVFSILLLSVYVVGQNATKQDTIYKVIPIFHAHKTFRTLQSDSLVLDRIPHGYYPEYDKSLLYLSIQTDLGQLDFFRANDTVFSAREKIVNTYRSYGEYKIDRTTPIDTYSYNLFDPETFAATLYICTTYPLQKIGVWSEQNSKNCTEYGLYQHGKRHGEWRICSNNRVVPVQYNLGQIIAYYKPPKEILDKNITWLQGRKWIWCKNNLQFYDNKVTKRTWTLQDKNTQHTQHCANYGDFIFNSDGTFALTLSDAQKAIKKIVIESEEIEGGEEFLVEEELPITAYELPIAGTGKWTINENNRLTLVFKDKASFSFDVSYLSEALLILDDAL